MSENYNDMQFVNEKLIILQKMLKTFSANFIKTYILHALSNTLKS